MAIWVGSAFWLLWMIYCYKKFVSGFSIKSYICFHFSWVKWNFRVYGNFVITFKKLPNCFPKQHLLSHQQYVEGSNFSVFSAAITTFYIITVLMGVKCGFSSW